MKKTKIPKEKPKKKTEKRQTSIITVFIWLLLIAVMTTITLTSIRNKNAVEKSELYDKIYVESATIEERKTGTGPFTTREDGTVPDVPEDGMDYSEDDNYVRTFDTVNYTISTIMRPNTDIDGVEETSVFYGGTIKVKATIPEVDGISYFKWIQQSWMQNVSITDDGRTLYAEYKIADTQKSAPGVQNLNFEMKAQGYVTPDGNEAPKPTFEIYMEGNKEENEDSTKEKVVVTDEEELYITGRAAFNVVLTKGSINYPGTYNGKQGYYINYGIGIELKQDVAEISDLRGLEYPIGEINAKIGLYYDYYDKTSNIGWKEVEANDPLGYGIANGIEIVGYEVNYNDNDAYWPAKNIRIMGIPRVKASSWAPETITDSGNMYLQKNGNTLDVKFDNYVIDGVFQKNSVLNILHAYFVVGQIELFAPNYDNDSSISYKYNVTAKMEGCNVKTPTKTNGEILFVNEELQDVVVTDNQLVWTNQKDFGTGMIGEEIFVSRESNWGYGDGYCVKGQSSIAESRLSIGGYYPGGSERILT